MEKKRILILTCSHGSGHRMVAETLKDCFESRGCNVFVRDLFNEMSHPINVFLEKSYLLSYNIGRGFYKWIYYDFEKQASQNSLKKLWKVTQRALIRILNEVQPDCIVNTYMYTITTILKEQDYLKLPIYTVVTDFCIPAAWMHPATTKYYVACQNVEDTLVSHGTPSDHIVKTGIPVRSAFYHPCDKAEIARKYGLDPKRQTLLICAGTHGVLKDLGSICADIQRHDDLQTIVICGRNKHLYNELSAQRFQNTTILGFVSDIHELYYLADMMVTKPGGITLSEVVVTGLPTILYKPTPGQEGENAQWFKNQGAAIVAENPLELRLAIEHLKGNEFKQYTMKTALKKMYYGEAASRISEDVLTDLKILPEDTPIHRLSSPNIQTL
ncbi:MGDG synthase family glycosyltransferase [Eubacterium aggregans]|uniref:MGDG synthase family glycosyltransferase n=1 Tax=Eubacterium aggregans TaxID=81409 RepID=UPI0023F325A9|nr:glycosyltransferase [Eubacterium aggregans]MDD4690643.1 glycosyltransferase [Eubacterium aggregans]